MADINKTESIASTVVHPRAREVDSIAALVRELHGSAARSVDFDGVGIRTDRISVAASARFTRQIESLHQIAVNAARAATVLDVADEALSGMQTRLDRMGEIAAEAALTPVERSDGSFRSAAELSGRERALLESEFAALRDEVDALAVATTFQGSQLLSGDTESPGDPLDLSFDLGGAGNSAVVTVSLGDSRVAALSADLETASLSSTAGADAAVAAVAAATGALGETQASVHGARSQLDSVESAAGEVSAVVTKVRDTKTAPETVMDLARLVSNQIVEEGGYDLSANTDRILQDVLLRVSASTANGGPASGGDGIEAFGGKTAGAPAAPPARDDPGGW